MRQKVLASCAWGSTIQQEGITWDNRTGTFETKEWRSSLGIKKQKQMFAFQMCECSFVWPLHQTPAPPNLGFSLGRVRDNDETPSAKQTPELTQLSYLPHRNGML
jgi:hypothetical protein